MAWVTIISHSYTETFRSRTDSESFLKILPNHYGMFCTIRYLLHILIKEVFAIEAKAIKLTNLSFYLQAFQLQLSMPLNSYL